MVNLCIKLNFFFLYPIETPDPYEARDEFEPELDNEEVENETDDVQLEPDDPDDEKDRLYDLQLVGKKIRGEYEGSGWHTGEIKYYNVKLDKYLLLFEDGSSDLIKEGEIDGVELCYVDAGPKRSQRRDYRALANGL